MARLFRTALAVAVACLVTVNVAWAQKKGDGTKREGKGKATTEQLFKDLGSKDGVTLTKADFLATAKAKGRDEARAQKYWEKIAGDKESITFEEFKAKRERKAAEGGKPGGGNKERKKQKP